MAEQSKQTTPEIRIPKPREVANIIVIGHLAITQTERYLDDLHEMRLLNELMAQ
jgi:hypothetical protein